MLYNVIEHYDLGFYISLQRKNVSEGNPLGQTFRLYAIFNAFPSVLCLGNTLYFC